MSKNRVSKLQFYSTLGNQNLSHDYFSTHPSKPIYASAFQVLRTLKLNVDILNYCEVPCSIFIQHVVVTRLQLPDF